MGIIVFISRNHPGASGEPGEAAHLEKGGNERYGACDAVVVAEKASKAPQTHLISTSLENLFLDIPSKYRLLRGSAVLNLCK